jgi:hypothetical protein
LVFLTGDLHGQERLDLYRQLLIRRPKDGGVKGLSRRLAGCVFSVVLLLSFAACSAALEQKPSSPVESAFDGFDQFQDVVLRSDPLTRVAASKIHKRYRTLFSTYQTSTGVAKLGPADITLLFRAAGADFLYSVSPSALHDMELDLAELHRRGAARKDNDEKVFAALVEIRAFDQARAFVKLHRLGSVEAVPEVVDNAVHPGATRLLVTESGKKLVREPTDLNTGPRIVVIASPLCHFCQRAIRSIESDASLRPVIRHHAIWIVPPDQSTPFATVATWNHAHPHEQMAYAYRREEWPMVERWETPVFYFFKEGRVVSKVRGWPIAGRKAEIRRSLRLAGLM